MTNLIHSLKSSQASLPSDNVMSATLTATVYTDKGVPADAGVEVIWAATANGSVTPATSLTGVDGLATAALTAVAPGNITVTATTADDAIGKKTIVTAIAPLIAPTVLNTNEADGYTLDQFDISFGVTATIPSYYKAGAGQTVTFNWGDVDQRSVYVSSLSQFPLVFDVTNDMKPECLADGIYEVSYGATDASGNTSYSASLFITVSQSQQTNPTLSAPVIPVAGDGYINIADANNGVEVDITYSSMVEGDALTLYWNATDKNSNPVSGASTSILYTVTAADVANTSIAIVLDSALFYPGQNNEGYEGYVDTYYTIHKAGQDASLLSYPTDAQVDTVAP